MIIENNWLPEICSSISGMYVTAITLFCWVFVRSERMGDDTLITHESIHVEQYKETLFLGFFLFYGYDFLKGILKGKSWAEAYEDTRFEIEAYSNEDDAEYLSKRKRYNWFRSTTG